MSNLDLWHSVEKTPPAHTKAITGKSYSGTSPRPHYMILRATEAFGPCGIGWGFTIVDERIEDGAGGDRLSIARVKVWYEYNGKRGEVEHIGGTQFSGTRASGKPFTDEDAPKKSVTDAVIKALSLIGFAGDIFMGRYDDSKYVSDLKNEANAEKAQHNSAPPPARNAGGSASSPRTEPPATITNSQKAYIEAFKFSLERCDHESEVLQLWAEHTDQRAKLGITKGSEAGNKLLEFRAKQIALANAAHDAAESMGAG